MKILRKSLLLLLNALLALSLCLFVCGCGINLSGSDTSTGSAHEHVWGEWEIEVESTCTTKGKRFRICTLDSSHVESETIIETGHHVVVDFQDCTCTEDGYYIEECKDCDYSVYEKIEKQHVFDFYQAQAPTCTEVGWEDYEKCTRCGFSTYEEKKELGHDLVCIEETRSTCSEKGTKTSFCNTCKEFIFEEFPIDENNHNFDNAMWKSTDNITMSKACQRCEFEMEQPVPNCEHSLRLRDLPWLFSGFIETIKTYYVCEHCQLAFELSDVLLLTFEDTEGGYRLTYTSKIPSFTYERGSVSNSEFDLNIKSESFSFGNDWREKRDEIKELVFSDNISTVGEIEYYEYAHTITFEKDVKKIQTNAMFECFGIETIYFEGDCPNLEPDALWRRNTAGHSADFAPVVYYNENAKGFEDYGYKLQGCSLRMIGAGSPEVPEMTMREYAERTNAKSIEIATELFKKAAKTRPFLQFIPFCALDKYKEIKDLALSLTQGLVSDKEKAKAIFDWIVENVTYDDEATYYSVEQVFATRKAVCTGYAVLMHDMLAAVEIPSFVTDGISYFGSDCTIQNLLNGDAGNAERHAWLICYIDGEATICDPTWKNFDISAERLSEENLLTTQINGIAVIPDEIDPTLYASLLYYDDGELYLLKQGYLSNIDATGTLLNGNFSFDFNFRKGNDGHDFGFSFIECQSAYSDAYMQYSGMDYQTDFFFGADFRNYNYTEVLKFLAFERFWYDNTFTIERIEEFLFADTGMIFHKNEENALTLVGTVSQAERIVIPETVNGLKVVAIDRSAFANSYAKEFVLPSTIEKIGALAFMNCENLETIVLPKNLKHIEPGAFAYCYNLKSVTMYASVEWIGFKDNKTLVSPDLLFADISAEQLKVYYQGTEEGFEKIYFNNPYVDPFNSTFDTVQYEHVKQYVLFQE